MKPRLLLVHPDKPTRAALAERLRQAGYEVDEADGGRAALAMVLRTPYQLVVLEDEAVLEEMRSDDLPVVMVTSPGAAFEGIQALFEQPVVEPDPAETLAPRLPGGVSASEALGDELPPGTEVGTFTLGRVLGRGGMGVVYQAVNRVDGRPVAIKLLHAHLSEDPSSEKRFVREARDSAGIDHPNVVSVYSVDKWGERLYIAMPLVEGGLSAQQKLQAGGPLAWRDATEVMIQACRGLSAAHAQGIIHRDLKPDNILIGQDGSAKVTDFGLAKAMTRTGETALTQAGTLVGTPHYMSPEQIRQQPLDARADVYSLGCTYYALLTGSHPYAHHKNWFQVLTAHCGEPPPELPSGLPAECAAIVRRAMAKAPGDRYPGAQAMLEALEALASAG